MRGGETLTLDGSGWQVLHTPGHSPGGVVYLNRATNQAIVGDTLFAGSIGRFDFPTSNADDLRRSISEVIMALPDETTIHPGHGPATTIGASAARIRMSSRDSEEKDGRTSRADGTPSPCPCPSCSRPHQLPGGSQRLEIAPKSTGPLSDKRQMSCALRLLIVALILALTTLGACYRPPVEAAPSPPPPLTVLTFNIRYGTAEDVENHWDQRKELVFDVLRRSGADLIALQEALRFQLDQIHTALPGYGEIGVGRADGKEGGEYTAILYRQDRFSPEESGTFWLSDAPEEPASATWGNRVPRVATWARLVDQQTDRPLYLFNTHLDHESQTSREKGIKLIMQRIQGSGGVRSRPARRRLQRRRIESRGDDPDPSHGVRTGPRRSSSTRSAPGIRTSRTSRPITRSAAPGPVRRSTTSSHPATSTCWTPPSSTTAGTVDTRRITTR